VHVLEISRLPPIARRLLGGLPLTSQLSKLAVTIEGLETQNNFYCL